MRRRLGPPLLGIGGVIAFLAIASGGGGASGGLVGILAIGLALRLVVSWVNRRRPAVADAWQPSVAISFRPAACHAASTPPAVSATLSRVEARELAFSAPFGVGVGFCLILIVLLGFVWGHDFDGEPRAIPDLFPIYVHPLAGMVILATHRARTRSTRDGTQELFDACPTSQATRTGGHLITAWVPALTATIFLLLYSAVSLRQMPVIYGVLGPRQAVALFGAALLCVGATALGVALARWAPWTPAPIIAIVMVGVLSIQLGTAGDRSTEPIRQLSTWLNEPELDLRFTAPHWLAHHLWILALVGIVAVLALARDVRRPWVPTSLAALGILAAATGVAATRPIDAADATRIASLINRPEAHQLCVQAAEVSVCTYESDRNLAEHLAEVIKPVTEAAPAGSLSGWVIRHGADLEVDQLDPAVRRLLDPTRPGERRIPIRFTAQSDAGDAARFGVALAAVGVAANPSAGPPALLDGQARGVIALWLATRGADTEDSARLTRFYPDASIHEAQYGRPWPDACYAGPSPVIWGLTDLEAARDLMAQPEEQVRRLLHAEWAHLTDPDTTTAELIAAAGLSPVDDRPGRTRFTEC